MDSSQHDPLGFYATARQGLPAAWEAARRAAGDTAADKYPTADRASRNRTLESQIARDSIKCWWGKVSFNAVVQDGQMLLMQEPGGTVLEGTVVLVASKEQFKGNFPDNDDRLRIQLPTVSKKLKVFIVTAVTGKFDETDASLTMSVQAEDAISDQ